MRRVGLFISLGITVIFTSSAIRDVLAQQQDRLKQLNETIRNMDLSVREMNDIELALAIQKNEDLLTKYTTNEFAPTVLFQLSELYIRKAKNDFEKAMEEYEAKYLQYQKKEIGVEPVMPRVDFGQAIVFLYEILDNYPSIGFVDKVLYRLALCHQEEGNVEKSIQFFRRLLAATPYSNFVPESYFRLGEHYFNQGEYDSAIEFYQKLVTADMWSTAFFDMSLYKLGWANYKLNRYPEAISAYMYLLKDIDALQRVQTQNLDRTASDLKQEAIAYIAVSFSEFCEPAQAFAFLATVPDSSYKISILSQLGDIFLRQDRMDEAVQTFQYLLEKFPLTPAAPQFALKVVEAYEKKWDLTSTNDARGVLIKNYNRGSAWYNAQSDSLIQVKALDIVKSTLYKKGIYHQLHAREANHDANEYQKAIEQYRTYLEFFFDDSSAYKINYFLAECQYALGQYEVAAEEYKKVYSLYPDNDYVEEAAYNAVLSYYKASQMYKTNNPQKFALDDFYGMAGRVNIEVGNPATQQFILSCNDFIRLIPQSPRTVDVLMKEAEVLNEMNRYDLSRRIYLKIVKDFPHSEQFALAVTMIAQSYFQEEDFAQAETWYGTVVSMLPDTMDVVKRATVMMASSHLKMGEKYKATGDLRAAAKVFAETAVQYPNSQIAELALVESGKMLESLEDTAQAAQVYEQFAERYPDSHLTEMCVLRAAKYRENIQQWEKAAKDYLILRFSDSPNRAIVVFSAGNCYFQAKNWQQGIDVFNEYLQIADDFNRKLEALCRTGLSWYELDNLDNAGKAFQTAIQTYQQLKSANNLNSYYVAQAQFMLGEINYIRFANIDLSPPFKENLNRKTEALKVVMVDYTEAAKFRVGEWTTAASYKIGKVFEEFANAILTSPVPEDLTEDEKLNYELQLKNMAVPFQKRALETYIANVKQADNNQISNTWVTLSKSQISMLSSVLNYNENEASDKTP